MNTDFDYNGAVFVTDHDYRYPLHKTGYIGVYPAVYSYDKCEDILGCARCETILNSNESQRFLKLIVYCNQGFFVVLRPHDDTDYSKILWRSNVEEMESVECVLCHNKMNLVPTIRNSKDVPAHGDCFELLLPYLQCAPAKVIHLIRVYLPQWCYKYLNQSSKQHFILEKLIWCFLRLLWNKKNNIKEKELYIWPQVQIKDNLSDEKEIEFGNSPTGYMQNTIHEIVDELLDKGKTKSDIDKQEITTPVNVFNVRQRIQLKFDAACNNKDKILRFGSLTVNLDRPYDMLAVLLIVTFISHPAYKSHYDKLLTSVDIHGQKQLLKLGHYDDILKIAIAQSFGSSSGIPSICYLCVDFNNPVIGIGDLLNSHAACVDLICLSKHCNQKYFVSIYVELPNLLLQYHHKIANLLIARRNILCELIGKCFDAVTKQKSIPKRQKLFGIGNSKDDTSFDWNLLRGIGDCTYDWDKWTTQVGMLSNKHNIKLLTVNI